MRIALDGLLGCGGLAGHVDDLNAAVRRIHRVARILRLGLAVTDRQQVGAGDAEFVDQIALD